MYWQYIKMSFFYHLHYSYMFWKSLLFIYDQVHLPKPLLSLYTHNHISLTSDCFFRQKEWLFALEDYQKAEELDPQNTAIWLRLAVTHNTLGLHSYENL